MEQAAKQAALASPLEQTEARVASAEPQAARVSSELRREDASRYCPVCSQRLESRRCKLICDRCGYYMSCSDYI